MTYATTADLEALWRPLKDTEKDRAVQLIAVVSSTLATEADKVGKDMDQMVLDNAAYADVAKTVVCDIVSRVLMTSTDSEPMTQRTESALGYSVGGTFLSPGGGIFIKRSELAKLGLRRQKMRGISLWD